MIRNEHSYKGRETEWGETEGKSPFTMATPEHSTIIALLNLQNQSVGRVGINIQLLISPTFPIHSVFTPKSSPSTRVMGGSSFIHQTNTFVTLNKQTLGPPILSPYQHPHLHMLTSQKEAHDPTFLNGIYPHFANHATLTTLSSVTKKTSFYIGEGTCCDRKRVPSLVL
jgi:hypothetical protein